MIFINGVTGSLGRYLLLHLQKEERKHYVIQTRLENASMLQEELGAQNVNDAKQTVALIHLAAMVPVVQCEEEPEQAHRTNVVWTEKYVKEFVRWAQKHGKTPQVIYVSSGHVYARPHEQEKINETHELLPRSVYAGTKREAEKVLSGLATQLGFNLIVPRVFGLLAPQQPPFYVLQGLLRRAQEKNFSNVPGLNSVRDYLDARDVSRILVLLSETDFSGVVNVCSGEGISIKTLLSEIVQRLYPLEGEAIISGFKAAPERADGVPFLVGDNSLLTSHMGIKAKTISHDTTVKDALRIYVTRT